MKVSPENIFPGAKVKLGSEDFTIIKVNAKSFYATTMSMAEFQKKWNNRKGLTFTNFCKVNEIKSYKYNEPFEIEENEFNRKDLAEANSSHEYKFGDVEKKVFTEMVDFFKKKKRSIKLFQFEVGKNLIRVLEVNGNSYLLNYNNDYVLYSFDTNECIKISTVYDFKDKYKEVPWEKLSCFASKQTAITA